MNDECRKSVVVTTPPPAPPSLAFGEPSGLRFGCWNLKHHAISYGETRVLGMQVYLSLALEPAKGRIQSPWIRKWQWQRCTEKNHSSVKMDKSGLIYISCSPIACKSWHINRHDNYSFSRHLRIRDMRSALVAYNVPQVPIIRTRDSYSYGIATPRYWKHSIESTKEL